MPSKEYLVAHLNRLLEEVHSAETDGEAWRRFRGGYPEPWGLEPSAYALLTRIERRLDELLERPSAVCRYSGEEREVIARLVTGVGETSRLNAVQHLSDGLAGARELAICDPYLLLPYRQLTTDQYVEAFGEALPRQLRSLELFYKPRTRNTKVADGINALCKERSIRLTCRRTEAIHDRVWIADGQRAYLVGTSFNGLGNKCAFILELPPEDRRAFLEELGNVREATTRSKSA